MCTPDSHLPSPQREAPHTQITVCAPRPAAASHLPGKVPQPALRALPCLLQAANQLPLTRRSYWLLGGEEDGLVLVHYLRSAKKGSKRHQQLLLQQQQAQQGQQQQQAQQQGSAPGKKAAAAQASRGWAPE